MTLLNIVNVDLIWQQTVSTTIISINSHEKTGNYSLLNIWWKWLAMSIVFIYSSTEKELVRGYNYNIKIGGLIIIII